MNCQYEYINVLLVEDSPSDARLIMEAMRGSHSLDFEITHVSTLAECLSYLANNNPDIILLDMGLPDSQWPRTLFDVVSKTSSPVIVLTGMDDEDRAIRSLREGAQDYIAKKNIDSSLSRLLRHAIERQKLRILIEQYAEAVKESEMRMLNLCVRQNDTVVRIGGDEFIVIVTDVKETRDAIVVAEKIIAALGVDFYPKGHKCNIGASIGISIYPDDGADMKELIKNADIAMYEVKERGRGGFRIYGQ